MPATPRRRAAFEFGGQRIGAGERRTVELPVSVLANHIPVTLPVHVVHGHRDGPVLFVSAAIHGDEILGVEIVRRVLASSTLNRLRGTLLAVPVVNAFGFIGRSRYLPDRRDLNRCFPGSAGGSLGAQLAHLFMEQVVRRASHGIDLHSGAIHRANLPQVRGDLGDAETRRLALSFGAPVIVHADYRDGSLRQAARDAGVHVLLYEAGEALRFSEIAIRVGARGVLRVMADLGMLGRRRLPEASPPVQATSSYWVRAPVGGILRTRQRLGDAIAADGFLGTLSDPFGETEQPVAARDGGLLIGQTRLPVVNRGDALFHVARVADPGVAPISRAQLSEELEQDPFDAGET